MELLKDGMNLPYPSYFYMVSRLPPPELDTCMCDSGRCYLNRGDQMIPIAIEFKYLRINKTFGHM